MTVSRAWVERGVGLCENDINAVKDLAWTRVRDLLRWALEADDAMRNMEVAALMSHADSWPKALDALSDARMEP